MFTVHEDAGGIRLPRRRHLRVLLQHHEGGADTGRGVAEYVDHERPHRRDLFERVDGRTVTAPTDATVSGKRRQNFLIYWDADETRELEDGTSITKYGGGTLAQRERLRVEQRHQVDADADRRSARRLARGGGLREADNSALRIYTTTDVTKRRIYTLMHDPTYRSAGVVRADGVQPAAAHRLPHRPGMADPPKPDIFVK